MRGAKRLLKSKKFIDPNSILYVAHRGSSKDRPENTISAFKKTLEDGILCNEIDLRLSKDNKIVIMHDETVDRTTNFSGLVKDYTFDELLDMDAGAWFGEDFSNLNDTRIPSFEEVLQYFKDKQMYFELDTKEEEVVDVAVPLIESYNMVDQCFFVGPEKTSNYVKDNYPQFISYRAAPYNDIDHHLKNAKTNGQEVISWREITNNVSDKVHENRRVLRHSWTKEDSESDIQRLIDLGVNFILTDYPKTAKKVGDNNGLVQGIEGD